MFRLDSVAFNIEKLIRETTLTRSVQIVPLT